MSAPPEGTVPFGSAVKMRINIGEDVVYANIRANVQRQVPQLRPYPERRDHCIIVGGGWSLDHERERIRDLRVVKGMKLFALNGAGNWLWERHILPSAIVVMDGKDDDGNRAFVRDAIPGCRYMLASQVHPSLFDICEGRDVTIWHALNPLGTEFDRTIDGIVSDYYGGRFYPVYGGGAVGVRALFLVKLLGFRFVHVFGLDSCYAEDGRHHAYVQDMNDGEGICKIWCARREFVCSAWQAAQARQFRQMTPILRDMNIEVYGDGLIAHMVRTGAELQEQKEAA